MRVLGLLTVLSGDLSTRRGLCTWNCEREEESAEPEDENERARDGEGAAERDVKAMPRSPGTLVGVRRMGLKLAELVLLGLTPVGTAPAEVGS